MLPLEETFSTIESWTESCRHDVTSTALFRCVYTISQYVYYVTDILYIYIHKYTVHIYSIVIIIHNIHISVRKDWSV